MTTIDLSSFGMLLKRNVGPVALVFMVFGIALLAWTLLSAVSFEAKGSILLGGAGGAAKASQSAGSDVELPSEEGLNVPSEIEILSSRRVVGNAILRSGLNVEISTRPTRTRYWEWLRSGRNASTIDGGYYIVQATDSGLVTQSERQIVVEFRDPSSYDIRALDGAWLGQGSVATPTTVDDMTLTLVPTGMAALPGQRLFLRVIPLDAVMNHVSNNLVVSSIKRANGVHSNVITAKFVHHSPYMATAFLDALLQGYLAERQAWETEAAVSAQAFIGKQLTELDSAIKGAHAELIHLRTSNPSLAASGMQESLASQLRALEQQYSAHDLSARTLTNARQATASESGSQPSLLGESVQDATLSELNLALLSAQAKLDELSTKLAPMSPDLVVQQQQVRSQLAALTHYLDHRLTRARERKTSLTAALQQLGGKVSAIPGADAELERLEREAQIYDGLHKFLLEQQQIAVLSQTDKLGRNRILDPPRLPIVEARPNLRLRLESLPLGVLMGMGLILASYFAVGKYQGKPETLSELHAHRVLGTVPERPELNEQNPHPTLAHAALHEDMTLADSIRHIQLQLKALCVGSDRGKVILLTSAADDDGKTTLALLLAWSFADEGARTLYLDANLRSPGRFVERDSCSLVEAIGGSVDWSAATTTVRTASGSKLLLLQCAAPIAPELLAEGQLQDMLRSMTDHLDYVVVDSPVSPPSMEVQAIASCADVTISVIRVGHTQRLKGQTHLAHLPRSAKSHAVVVNGVQEG